MLSEKLKPEQMLAGIRSMCQEHIADEITMEVLKNTRQIVFKCAGNVLFYYFISPNNSYIKLSPDFDAKSIHSSATKYKDGSWKAILNQDFDIENFMEMMGSLSEQKYNGSASITFGCCHDFIQCSDARKCLHLGDPWFKGCYYRKNLETGRIFYGKNKNYANPVFP